jgi:hypothetical protein
MPFFNAFPQVAYDITRNRFSQFQSITNITFRVGIIKSVISNIGSYFVHTISDTETPDILAEQVYNNAEAYWIILYANDIYDPHYDWPLNSREFRQFIIDKYGSTAIAKTTNHHFEKIISRHESASGLITSNRITIDEHKLVDLTVPYESYDSMADYAEETVNMGNGHSVLEVIERSVTSNYDYEYQLNESKREIKLIKAEYYGQIMSEYNELTRQRINPHLRKLY